MLSMKAGTKLALCAALAVAILIWSPLGSTLRVLLPGDAGLRETPLELTYRPLEPTLMRPTRVEPSADGPPRTVVEAAAPREEREPAAAPSKTGVRMRFVDPSGAPVARVRLQFRGQAETSALSDRLGFAEVWSRTRGLRRRLIYEHPGFAPGEMPANLKPGHLAELGDIVLTPAGVIAVCVQDPRGVPIEGAWVEAFSKHELGNSRRLEGDRLQKTVYSWGGHTTQQVTDASGRLLVKGVAAGTTRLWAGIKGRLAAYTPPIEIRAGMQSEDVVITLEEFDPSLFIFGQVVDPSGVGFPNARVKSTYSSGGGSSSSIFSADREGRFMLAYYPKAPRNLHAQDQANRYGGASAQGVEGGADIVLRLTEPQHLLLNVTSESGGGELEGLTVWGYNAEHTSVLVRSDELTPQGGTLRVPIPGQPFLLEVSAEGHDRSQLGPYDPLTVPRELHVALRPLPGVRGIVSANGAPLPGAKVELYALARGRSLHNGYPVRVQRSPWAHGTTDAEGSFALTLRRKGEFFLRASADGLAPTELGPLALDPERGLGGLTVELTGGGAIEGIVSGETQIAGHIVALSRGDAHARTTRTDGEGLYRFEHLIPGRWQVELADEEISPHSSSWSNDSAAFSESDLKTNCDVLEGQTTHHDISLTAEVETTLVGTLLLDGAAAVGWQARLTPEGDRFQRSGSELEDLVGEDGTFRITVRNPGGYRLALGPPDQRAIRLTERLQLVPGENLWRASFETGAVSFINAPPAESGLPTIVLVGSDGKTELVVAVGGAMGVLSTQGIPVMPCQLRRIDPSTLNGFENLQRAGTLLMTVELRAGERVEIIVP
jgi:protocatechuate 3,4-dioxygenase beta subunit